MYISPNSTYPFIISNDLATRFQIYAIDNPNFAPLTFVVLFFPGNLRFLLQLFTKPNNKNVSYKSHASNQVYVMITSTHLRLHRCIHALLFTEVH